MKKILLILVISGVGLYIAAQQPLQPNTCVLTTNNLGNDVTVCNANSLGTIQPCGNLLFIVTNYLPAPAGYSTVGKFEWYVNGTLIKTTTDASDPLFNWAINAQTTNIYCKVTFKKEDGTLSSPYTSTTFTSAVKALDFQGITTSTGDPQYGCSATPVSYSLGETPCTGSGFPCNSIYNVSGNYTITWQAPAGWLQTDIQNKGSNVTFLPDATSALCFCNISGL